MARLNNTAKARRDLVEEGLVRGTAARNRLAMALLRTRQAIDRSPDLRDLLGPGVDDLALVRNEIVAMQNIFEAIWQEMERVDWEIADV